MGAHAVALRRVPPMLHIALGELARRGQHDLRAQHLRRRPGQRHRVLQLVAKSVRTPGLVEAGPRPQAARHRLVQQPAVHQGVEQRVGCLHRGRAEQLVPCPAHRLQAPRRGGGRGDGRQALGGVRILRMAEQEHLFHRGAGGQHDAGRQRGAGIESTASCAGRSGRAAPGRRAHRNIRAGRRSSPRPPLPRPRWPGRPCRRRSRPSARLCVHSKAVSLRSCTAPDSSAASFRSGRRWRCRAVYTVARSTRFAPIIHSAMPIARRCSVLLPRLTSRSRTCLTELCASTHHDAVTSTSPRRWLMTL